MASYLVMKNSLKRYLRHKPVFAVTFLIPLIMCILFGLVDFDMVSLRVGILTEEGTKESVGSTDELNKLYRILNQTAGITYAQAKEERVNMDLMTGHFQVVLECRGQNLSNIRVIAYKPTEYTAYLQKAVSAAITDGKPLMLEGLKKKGLGTTERTITMLLTLFIIFSILYASPLIRDKQTGTYLRYQYAKSSRLGYLSGQTASVFCVTLVQVLCCMVLLSLVSTEMNLDMIRFIVMSVAIAGLAALISMLICYVSKSEVQAGVIASSVSVLMSLLGGTFAAIDAMPWLLRMLSYASPMRWVVELLHLL